MGGGINPQYLTLAYMNAFLKQERGRHPKIPKQFSRDLSFSTELLNKSYPKGYESLKFNPYDGRKGSTMEHIGRFVDTIGPHARDKELFLREFAKSLVDRAYTWYTTLRPWSIRNWDDMIEKFCAKYYLREDKVTFSNLQVVKQRVEEDPLQVIKRFEDVSLNCYGEHEERELIETCISNMLYDYKINLENQCIIQFADLLQKTRRIALTIKTKRVPSPQAMVASVREKRKRPVG